MRLQWASAEIEKVWRQRLGRIQNMIFQIEQDSITLLGRRGALITLPSGSQTWFGLPLDLFKVPVGISKLEDYSNGTKWPSAGEPFSVKMLLTKEPQSIPMGDESWGKLLGYPDCCIAFFKKTWSMGETDTLLSQLGAHLWNVGAPVNATHNITLKHLGIRPVFHLPCSYDCKGTAELAAKHKSIATDVEAWGWMEEILLTPYKISINKGVAEIVHPLFRTTYETVLLQGTVNFVKPDTVRETNVYDSFWKDNGFSNFFAMEKAHGEIVNEITGLHAQSIMDLGAGNGFLLAKLGRLLGPADLIAVENVKDRIARCRVLHPEVTIREADIRAVEDEADIVLISSNRFDEGIPVEHVGKLARRFLIIYNYEKDIVGSFVGLDGFVRLGTKNRRVHVYKRQK